MIYLASPYSHPDATVSEHRFHAACRAAAWLIQAGSAVFSPIAHGHPIALYGVPTDWRFWEPIGRKHLARCDEVLVLPLDGWRESSGVQAEIRMAAELGNPVRYLDLQAAGSPTLSRVANEAKS